MTSRRRLSPKAPEAKCKQCGHEKAMHGRADGLGRNCAHYRDYGARQVAEAKAKKAG